MSVDNSQSQEVDLDRTDRLPVLAGVVFDDDVEDDAVRMDYAPVVPSVKTEFPRPSGVDLPSLAESVRSVEERIARQNADYDALSRSYDKARDAEAAAVSRATMLTADIASLRSMLESEQARSRDLDKTLAEKNAAAEATVKRVEDALREAERFQSEARTLRDTLAARDATIVQVTHSLGERDAQLTALQHEHAQIVPALKERSRLGEQLEADLHAERQRSAGIAVALKDTQQSGSALGAQLKAASHELQSTRQELGAVKAQAVSYFEQLRTREWRRGFDHNMFRELDAKIGAVEDGHGALQRERDQLRQRIAELESQLAARDEAIAKLQAAATAGAELRSRHEATLSQAEKARIELMQKLAAVEAERARLKDEVAARDGKIAEQQAAAAEHAALRASDDATLRHAEAVRIELMHKITALEGEQGRLRDDLTARDRTISKLKVDAEMDESARSKRELVLQQAERACADLTAQLGALEKERSRLNGELALRDRAIADAQAAMRNEAQHSKELLAAGQTEQAELAAQMQRLQSELKKREDEMGVLLAHLQEARRPLEPIEAEVKRLTDEVAAKAASLEQLNEDNRSLRAALERARGALEEREFLIRRLERSESNNANVLGRIQTSIERLGSGGAGTGAGSAAAPVECTAELVRVDGQHNTSHVLARRTRIGRATGCEMQIESSSVSRHHALVLMGSRDVIIEDLNSTNGVLVNGRKVSRQLLNDGDLVTIGEAQFRLSVKLAPRTLEAPAADPPAGG
ncbi:MAG: FHA domain-containing protein [Steroidobacteraceae bacterium]